ncbi:fimbrial assembly protein [Acidiphilium sp. PA]|uniref:PilN domain-containing protein n=1 Tax=Acidiphilium sp. PA TaxID=2871705 RepID=UPI002243C9BD|nr:PilN domain-containing protein [Acidiphilium sp. PA]MCW8305955.1 fimbrial assembly protein [Acidiphilium sp. PA]
MELFRWYGAMLGSLLPAWLRAMMGGGAPALVVTADPAAPGRAMVALRARGGLRDLGPLGALPSLSPALRRAVTLILAAPARLILTTTITLPLAAERHLATAVAFEMDRLTPFDPEEIWFGTEILRRDRAAGLLALRLAVLPRQSVAPLLDALAAAGLHATRIEDPTRDGMTALTLDHAAPPARRLDRVLATLCGLLALACLITPLARQQSALAALAAQHSALAPRLHEAEVLRARLAAASQGAATLAREQAREGDALAALAAITTALPDRSFLTDFSFRHGVATLDGESPNAAGLVAALSADHRFADPAFAAPVTRALNEHADIFSIRVKVRQHGPR